MNYKKQVSRFFFLMLIIALSSCMKSGDFDFSKMKSIEWNPKMAVPLVSSSLTIMDILKQPGTSSSFVIDQKGFVTLVYKDRLFSINPASMVTIPSTSFVFSHTFTAIEAAAINSSGKLTIPFQTDIKLTPADSIRIDSLICSKGDLTLTITGTVNNTGSIALSIPDAKKNGLPFNATFTPLANGIKTTDLSGYKFDLTRVTGKRSTFRLNASITITNLPAGSITAGKVINFNFRQHIESVKVLSGYLGRFFLFSDKKTENLSIFNNALTQGQFTLVDPYLKFTFSNSIGVPIQLRFSELRGTNNAKGQSLNLAGNPGLPNPINLASPSYIAQPGAPAGISTTISTYTVTNTGTGGALNKFLNIKPNSISYNFYSLTNPGGNISENFVRDSSKLIVDVEVGLPLYGYAKNLAIQDTLDFKLDNISDAQSLLIRTIIDNGFPLEARMQVFFTDANYVRLDSLITADPFIIPAAQITLASGELLNSSKKTSDFTYPRERINKITGTKKILVKALLNTSGTATQNIRIFNTYQLKVKLAVQAEIKIKL